MAICIDLKIPTCPWKGVGKVGKRFCLAICFISILLTLWWMGRRPKQWWIWIGDPTICRNWTSYRVSRGTNFCNLCNVPIKDGDKS